MEAADQGRVILFSHQISHPIYSISGFEKEDQGAAS
jgi:hypothetical protein